MSSFGAIGPYIIGVDKGFPLGSSSPTCLSSYIPSSTDDSPDASDLKVELISLFVSVSKHMNFPVSVSKLACKI